MSAGKTRYKATWKVLRRRKKRWLPVLAYTSKPKAKTGFLVTAGTSTRLTRAEAQSMGAILTAWGQGKL